VFHLPEASRFNSEQFSRLRQEFETIKIFSAAPKPDTVEDSVQWLQYNPESEGLVVTLNQLISNAEKEWVLFLDADEDLRFYSLPEKENLTSNSVVPAHISQVEEKSTKTIYQVRMVHRSAETPFSGKNLPDCTSYVVENDVDLFDTPIQIVRNSNLTESVKVEEEMSMREITPSTYLLQAERLMIEKKYVQAAAHYRNILKVERLLPFDRLGAVNGLTRCYTEQYKWPKALQLADKSVEAEPVQRFPYLIQYRIHQLNKQWDKAYSSLKAYYEYLDETGRASYDKEIDEKETLEQLGELATKAGHKEDAFKYLEEIYAEKKGQNDDRHLLRKLLMIAIELGKRERAIFYFKEIFEEHLPDQLNGKLSAELNDYMALFMKNEWYAFVGELYERLYTAEPENAEYRRRLIVAFSKTDRLARARKLIAI
jgi:tetratricopeptide (TPR) repeat protein